MFEMNSSNSSVDPVHIMKISSITLFQVCMDSGAWVISCVTNLSMNRPWQIMLKFLPIFLFLYSPIFHLFFFLFYPFCFSINSFFSNIVVAT